MPNISVDDLYTDSMTELTIWRAGERLESVRAVIHWASNVGFYVRLPNGGLITVMRETDDTYSLHLPDVQDVKDVVQQ